MIRKALFLSVLLCAFCNLSFAQKKFAKISVADFATPAEAADSSADAVYIYNIGDTHFEILPSGFILRTQIKVRMHILTEKGKEYANQSVVYRYNEKQSPSMNDKLFGLSAASYNLVDGKVVKTAMSGKYEFEEKVDDYTRRTKFTIPEVKVGSIIEYKYTIDSPHYTYIPTWYMQKDEPVRYSYYVATIPEWFKYQVEQRGSSSVKFDKSGNTIQVNLRGDIYSIDATKYTLEAENLKSFKDEKFIYCKSDYMQRMDFELSGVEIPGEVYKSYTYTWDDVRTFLDGEYDYGSNLKMKNPYAADSLYPLAYIDGVLYFTNNPNHITMNDKWGNGTIYYIHTDNIAEKAEVINTNVTNDKTIIFKLTNSDPQIIKTSQLGKIINEKSDKLIEQFVAHCKAHQDEIVKIKYQDEHLKSVLSMMLCLQTVGYFVRQIGSRFMMEFLIERYDSDRGNPNSLGANQPSSVERDEWLENLAESWLDDMERDYHIQGRLHPIVSLPKRTLTHWRVLSFECAGKTLSIYPDGGFINGWLIYNRPGRRHEYDMATIIHDTEVNICRNQDIKYDVTIEDVIE